MELDLAAVVGHPVSHSLSPRLFDFLAKKLRRPLVYKKLDLRPEDLAPFFWAIENQRFFVGWNVTVPHKEAVARMVDDLSPAAKKTGAVNVVHFTPVGAEGHNTDVIGIDETLREQKVRLAGGSALLYGAGGAARAVAYSLGEAGAKNVYVLNRTAQRGEALCRRFARIFPGTDFQPIRAASETESVRLIVNATSAGLKGKDARFDLPARVEPGALAFDLLYGPSASSFLKQAGRRGFRTVSGLDMLVWQALATWEIWYGKIADRAKLKRAVKRHLEVA